MRKKTIIAWCVITLFGGCSMFHKARLPQRLTGSVSDYHKAGEQAFARYRTTHPLQATQRLNDAGRLAIALVRTSNQFIKDKRYVSGSWRFWLAPDTSGYIYLFPAGDVVVSQGLTAATDSLGISYLTALLVHSMEHENLGHNADRLEKGLVSELEGVNLKNAMKWYPNRTDQLVEEVAGVRVSNNRIQSYSHAQEKEVGNITRRLILSTFPDTLSFRDAWDAIDANVPAFENYFLLHPYKSMVYR